MKKSKANPRPTRSPTYTVDQARAFCAVAEAASYKEAAKQLGLREHVTLVRLVSRFSKALGFGRLLESEAGGKVRLTSAGTRVLPAARGFVNSADELAVIRPEIRFSAYPTITARMAQLCPGLLEQEVPLVLKNISEANRQDGGWTLVHDVAAGRLDMAIAPAKLPEESLIERRVYSWRLRVILPRTGTGGIDGKHNVAALRERQWVTPQDIVGFRIAVAPLGHKSRSLLHDAFAMANLDLNVALESPNQELLRAVADGGKQFVAVIPGDAFPRKLLRHAPYLHVKGVERHFGGSYALYMRETDLPTDETSAFSHQIADAADSLIKAFKKDEERK
jgi:DNA-binding transcriptional LysR family regulator